MPNVPSQTAAPSTTIATTAQPKQSTATTPEPANEPKIVSPFPGIRVHVNDKYIELDGETCYEVSWLEFIACSPNTKEHESLVVLPQRPSNIHAAMLLAGFESGQPGRWTFENEKFALIPPTGSKLRIAVRYTDRSGKVITRPVCEWIQDHLGKHTFPCESWVFAGSIIAPNPKFMGDGEHYVADVTGSVIGLATFSDELIGYSTVISPESDVQAPEWVANNQLMPADGSKVTVIIRAWESE